MHVRPLAAATAVAAITIAATAGATAGASTTAHRHYHSIKHVLLISVDGLHQQDLSWFVKNFPDSALAKLTRHGVDYTRAMTPFPSDSFPGMVGQVTGGDPGVTGIYYDDTFNRDVFPAGTTNCTGPVPGAEVAYTEADDINLNSSTQRTCRSTRRPASRSCRTSTSR